MKCSYCGYEDDWKVFEDWDWDEEEGMVQVFMCPNCGEVIE